jgi:hypothetical protein
VIGVFAASRAWAWSAGVRFDTSPLYSFWQIIDPTLLKTHLLQSLWYFHAQPPLYNLLLGIGLKLFGSDFVTAAHGSQIALGVAISVMLYVLLVEAGVGRWWAAAVTAVVVVSPATFLYENWLFYEYLVTALLLLAALALRFFEKRPSTLRSLAVFATLAAVCYVRATFQIVVLLLVLGFMLLVFSKSRRSILLGAAVPLLLVAGLSVKNWILFGTPSTTSWTGMNLMQVDQVGFRDHEEQNLQRSRVISPISAITVFDPLSAYRRIVPRDTAYSNVPVLSDTTKPSAVGSENLNNIEYVSISNDYLHDFEHILTHEPSIYFRGVWSGLKQSVVSRPTTPALQRRTSTRSPEEGSTGCASTTTTSFGSSATTAHRGESSADIWSPSFSEQWSSSARSVSAAHPPSHSSGSYSHTPPWYSHWGRQPRISGSASRPIHWS